MPSQGALLFATMTVAAFMLAYYVGKHQGDSQSYPNTKGIAIVASASAEKVTFDPPPLVHVVERDSNVEMDRLDWADKCKGDLLFGPDCLQRCVRYSNETVWFPKPAAVVSATNLSCHYCPHYKPVDTLFSHLEFLVASRNREWGDLLDAGTGVSSLKWAKKLDSLREVTAVTVSESMMAEVAKGVLDKKLEGKGAEEEYTEDKISLVRGDWGNSSFLADRKFDNILADYLVGAMDGFTPFIQDTIFSRLGQHLRDADSRILVVGMEPYPERALSVAGKLVIEVARLRDACILLHKERAYREYPVEWIVRALGNAGFEVTSQVSFPLIMGKKKLLGQLQVCTSKFAYFTDPTLEPLRRAFKTRAQLLTREIEANAEINTGLCFGMDYVVEARKKQAPS